MKPIEFGLYGPYRDPLLSDIRDSLGVTGNWAVCKVVGEIENSPPVLWVRGSLMDQIMGRRVIQMPLRVRPPGKLTIWQRIYQWISK
jgi:hypothetical protein